MSEYQAMCGRTAAVFLDRDGTLNEDFGHPTRREELAIYPAALEAVRKLNENRLPAVVVSNQSVVARGMLSEGALQDLHNWLKARFQEAGAVIDAVYYCPHHPEGKVEAYRVSCECRKPQPGLLLRAAEELKLDLARSWIVGDQPSDVEAGLRAGCRTVLVLTGKGQKTLEMLRGPNSLRSHPESGSAQPDLVASDVLEAVEKILAQHES